MKKIYAIFGLALAMLTVGCAQDATNDLTPTGTVKIGVNIEESTRTQLGELNGKSYPVLWSEGDKIAVNGVASAAVDAQYVGSSKAVFEISNIAAPYSIVYPAEVVDKTTGNINVATEQEYVPGNFASGVAVLVGYAQEAVATMKNLYSFVKVVINKSGEETLRSVTVEALGGEVISGEFAVDYPNAKVTAVEGKNFVRVFNKEGIPYVEGKAEVVVAIPAGTYARGFSLTIVDATGKSMTKTAFSATGLVAPAGVLLNMPELTFAGTENVVTVTTAAELADAMSKVAWENPMHIVLGADIDMAGVEFASVEAFYGVFDGKDYSIKNWNASRGLINENFGVVKNVVIDASCILTVDRTSSSGDQNVAFIVENNAEPALITGCINNGKVVATDISTGAHRLGGVCGVSYGTMTNCTNNGEISITSPAVNNGQFLGGVVGYCNPNAGTKDALGTDFLVGCVNTGKVDVLFPCQPKKVYVGGVLGATQVKASTSAVNLGQIKDCVNRGDVSYRFEVLNSGTYGNVGGVVGYAQVDIEGCDNYGKVSFTTPVDDLNQGGTRPAAGGVIGCNLFKVKDCDNHGELYVNGVWAAGTQDADGAGSQGGSVFGGVVGCSGVYNVYSADYPVENCHNYGVVNINNNCKISGGTKGWHAGVVGYTTGDVIGCTSNAQVNIAHKTYENYSAGIVGETKGSMINCAVNAPVVVNVLGVSKDGGALYLSGLAGYVTVVVDNCHLNADFTATTVGSAGSLRFAGIVGQIKTASDRTATISNCTVKEGVKLSFTTDNANANYCGGIVGLANNGVDKCTNNGDIDIKVTGVFEDGDITYVAGVAGAQQEDMTGCVNNGNITVDMNNSTGPFYAGTILGDNKKAGAVVSGATNSGNMTIVNAGNVEFVNILVGHSAEETTVDTATCTNTGVVTVNGSVLQ